jgi:hypothetical protein
VRGLEPLLCHGRYHRVSDSLFHLSSMPVHGLERLLLDGFVLLVCAAPPT